MSGRTLVLEIKGNSLDDGPGIRSVVFFKGCPLSCFWCHNPESKRAGVEISFQTNACVACDACLEICSLNALSRENPFFVNRERCNLCFECVDACPSGALARVGTEMSVETVVEKVIKDKPFHDTSGGGVTFSGGEPVLHLDFLSKVLSRLKKEDVHTLVETCGHFNLEKFQARIYPHTDMIFYDIKIIDELEHKRYCGQGNKLILKNFAELHKQWLEGGVEVRPRIPLIPGITDNTENIDAIISLFREVGVVKTHLMPYHPLWQEKNRQIGIEAEKPGKVDMDRWIAQDQVKYCEKKFHAAGIKTG
ncbi:MAG: glycyl-radical enzyme activating protein [Desulfobacterales bacterium]|nr:glycyl-radical enzyme activating protein [Desulfobacterales bacterium]